MSERGQKYRACAKECRRQAQSFRDPKARTRMFQIAADYDRKARQAEAFEPQDIKNE
jgi:hypothetical protein